MQIQREPLRGLNYLIRKTAHSLAVGGFDFYGKSTENIYMQVKPIELIWVIFIVVKAIFTY